MEMRQSQLGYKLRESIENDLDTVSTKLAEQLDDIVSNVSTRIHIHTYQLSKPIVCTIPNDRTKPLTEALVIVRNI